MHDALIVRRRQRIQYTHHQFCSLSRRHGGLAAAGLRQRRAFDIFEDEIGLAVDLIGLKDRHHVRVAQAADGAGLVQPLGDGI